MKIFAAKSGSSPTSETEKLDVGFSPKSWNHQSLRWQRASLLIPGTVMLGAAKPPCKSNYETKPLSLSFSAIPSNTRRIWGIGHEVNKLGSLGGGAHGLQRDPFGAVVRLHQRLPVFSSA